MTTGFDWSDYDVTVPDFQAGLSGALASYKPGGGGGKNDGSGGKGPGGGGGKGDGGGKGGSGGGGKGGGKDGPVNETKPTGSAAAIIEGFLQTYGLQGLGTWAWNRWKAGDSIEEIMLGMRSRPEYLERFPAMEGLAGKGRAISEGEYIAYERSVANLSARYGIPEGIYTDRQAVAKLMLNDLSPVEIEQNMSRAAAVVFGTPEIRQAFGAFYGGNGDGAAIAFFLDPDAAQPILEQQYAATQIAGNALAQGLGVTKAEAERMAQLTRATEAEAQRAALVAGTQKELFANLLGETGAPTAGQGVSAALGADAADVAAVEARRSQRRAAYQEGGTFAAGNTGVSGLGSARR